MKEILSKREDWATKEIKKLIKDRFGPDSSEKHVETILKGLGIKFANHVPRITEDPQTLKNS